MKRERRRRPTAPYRSYPIRRVLMECNRRLSGAHGPRAWLVIAALIYRSPKVQSGIVYLGDSCTEAGREHVCGACRRNGKTACEHEYCCMARLIARSGKTAHRAKYDLADAGLIRLHNAGRRLCPCRRCNGGNADPSKNAGGSIFDGERHVGAATGYELDPGLFAAPPPIHRGGRPPAPPDRKRYVSPAEERIRREGMGKIRDSLERMRSRAGP